ncbi:dihydrolipoamide acetyltransferase family protein [Bacillus mojavensis]|uniref:dihydrolipoamide acetyltransferase family protein n=1 Tax=Bacillus mojavensis TaxID=72360 RepID=UPI002DB8BAE8|nr:dihydrolipoamide acetyltransferase family protein [Bacillus mojavensis]MEC1291131.1 dihydrolipoamide acetyltransferase family protein [Bacillus mojavensis]MEC1615549.1 dihydrolipoamide acetyltransferase family protein [Bacillus mojavensis]MEC1691224.1 dihydrolipoamide acetyltransferase family protein [Bacillus mojavensis]MEC1703169.1 dihydrolipoamide acetyltransferase family protein [Bacillus mojavensis]MEC5248478.1 dihydrolipoamide acetyltransferase family protein [Bacillus mojavensis]
MAVKVVMPKLGMAMKQGEVSIWNKKVGDPVEKGESIASIQSEKIEMEIEAPEKGTLIDIKVKEGEEVPPGTAICYIGDADESVQEETEEPASEASRQADPQPSKHENKPANTKKDRLKISPVARKIAEKAGLDLKNLKGTGPGGRIVKDDVTKALSEQKREQAEPVSDQKAQETPVTGMRKVIASRMQESLANSAQLTITMKADITKLAALQKQLSPTAEERHGTKLTMTHFVSRAAVLALQSHPMLNSFYKNERIITHPHVHLGMAVALEKGLVVPVIRHAEKLPLIDLAKVISENANKAREGRAGSEELQGSTFSITNLGAFGVEHFTPILNPPETGILGIGASYDTPVYLGEEIVRSTVLPLSLTFDHRVCDGAPAAAFLKAIKTYLEEPAALIL